MFMSESGIPFFYEPEGYRLQDGSFYLPDFYLPNQDAFMEIKNPLSTASSKKKPRSLVDSIGKIAFVISQPPLIPFTGNDYSEQGFEMMCPEGGDCHYLWCLCPRCGRGEIHFDGRADRIGCKCKKSRHGDRGHNYNDPKLLHAYEVATAWRFEE